MIISVRCQGSRHAFFLLLQGCICCSSCRSFATLFIRRWQQKVDAHVVGSPESITEDLEREAHTDCVTEGGRGEGGRAKGREGRKEGDREGETA